MTSWIFLLILFTINSLSAGSCIEYQINGTICREYHDAGGYYFEDGEQHRLYTYWDNQTICDYDTIVDDPLLVIRAKAGSISDSYQVEQNWLSWARFSHFYYPPHNEPIEALIPPYFAQHSPSVEQSSDPLVFDHTPIRLPVPADTLVEWQINRDPAFTNTALAMQGQTKDGVVALHPLAETLLTAGETYLFRYREENGQWSEPAPFVSMKPKAVLHPVFTPEEPLTLSWNSEPETNYWIFASNALDFVPEIYSPVQLEGVDESGTPLTSPNENLFVVTQSNRVNVSDGYCFYRIIPEKNGMFGTPSPLVYVYSPSQKPLRSVLSTGKSAAERIVFPMDHQTPPQSKVLANVKPPHVSRQAWSSVARWIMPLNHAVRAPLDRIFSQKRALADEQSLLDAGFTNALPGNGSQTVVTEHPKVKWYVLKLYRDDQPITDEWKDWVHRASGAEQTRHAIKAHKYYPLLVSPYAWIYPLPALPRGQGDYAKDFILVSDKMPRLSDAENLKRWNRDMDRERVKAIYTLVEELGLVNATTAQNLPWTRNKRNVFIDFEKHHVWPTQVVRLQQWLRPSLQQYLRELISGKG